MKIYKTLPDGTEIVEYEDSLAQAIADMWNRSGEGWGGSFDTGVYTAERMIAKRASGVFFNVYVAMKDGEAIGYCSYNRYYKDADTAYVHVLNVRPDHHGKGLGKELVLMCVNETIARGMPRLDIHTWPGNTKAVPMYKKCGYFWEDRADTTHLSNFIPTVLSTELVKDYFLTADWYTDSTRKIDIKPDGKKVNKFELYEYEWEKDGKHLRVGFEKTGRRINLIETDDYRIEMVAENHELAYGLSYPCKFLVSNKTGNELDVKITAKNDSVISFNGSWSGFVAGEETFGGTFFVNAVEDIQDDMKMHPCVLADVCINGKSAEFGLGINVKFPIAISLGRKQRVVKTGMTEDVYLNIKNGLSSDAVVKFTLPENPLMQFSQKEYDVKLPGGKDISLATSALLTGLGYSGIPVTSKIIMDNNDVINITRPLHIVNQGVTGQFGFETDEFFGAANGSWRIKFSKQKNEIKFDRVVEAGYGAFYISQLGKPYDDEFNIMKPADVRVTHDGAYTNFELDFVSGKFTGAVLTEIFSFDSAGTLSYNHRVTNKGSGELDLSIKSEFWTSVGRRPVFPYDGGFHEVSDKMNFGFDTLKKEKIDENWVFDSSDGCPAGMYWPTQYKPDVRWGDLLVFEFPTGALSAGQSFETEPFVYMYDTFKNFWDFRNYVLGLQEDVTPFTHNHLEILANGSNPVLSSESLDLVVRNNRLNIHGGTVAVSSPNGVFAGEQQTNPDDEIRAENAFNVSVSPGCAGSIGFADFSLRLTGFEKEVRRVLMITDDSVVKINEHDGIFTVENGKICFKLAPGFSDAVYSLKYGENEWLFSKYPSVEPYAWWNPFVGGLKTNLNKMGDSLVLREKISATFISETDELGNIWSGIRCDVIVENFDEYKGMKYSQYYLTLPGVPVMCHFTKFENNTGRFFDAEMNSNLVLSDKSGLSKISARFSEDSIEYKLHPGGIEDDLRYDRLVTISYDKENPRSEKLYIYKDAGRDNGKQYFGYDIDVALCYMDMKGSIPDGGVHKTKPIICILSEKDIKLNDLDDLNRISF